MPVRDNLVVAAGRSFSEIDSDVLYVLYSRGLNSKATIENAFGSIRPIRG